MYTEIDNIFSHVGAFNGFWHIAITILSTSACYTTKTYNNTEVVEIMSMTLFNIRVTLQVG